MSQFEVATTPNTLNNTGRQSRHLCVHADTMSARSLSQCDRLARLLMASKVWRSNQCTSHTHTLRATLLFHSFANYLFSCLSPFFIILRFKYLLASKQTQTHRHTYSRRQAVKNVCTWRLLFFAISTATKVLMAIALFFSFHCRH